MTGSSAMVLAAGLGRRMRPLTDDTPKPLIAVAGKPIIGHVFDRLREGGVARAVVNVHHLPEQIERWAAQASPPASISDERDGLLETGGGVAKALPMLGADPFFVLNGDSFWVDAGAPALNRMREAWAGLDTDCLLLLMPLGRAVGYDGEGDFDLGASGRVSRRVPGRRGAHVFAGCYLASPRLFADAPQGPFSTNLLWDRAIARGRLHGLAHDGLWLHVGTPDAIGLAERALADAASGPRRP
jgi:MurNAc alpha-1-phosphate uridylyltransferase